MPLYEYLCEKDGTVIELLRPMADADRPVEDPEQRGRTFKRKLSAFAPKSTTSGAPRQRAGGVGGCCPCGKRQASCGTT